MATNEEINRAARTSTKWLKARQAKHLSMVQESIKVLQDNIINAMTELSTTGGAIESAVVNYTRSQMLHQRIVNLFATSFDQTTREVVNDFTSAHEQVRRNFATMGEIAQFTGADMGMFNALRDGYYTDYLAIGNQARDKITRAMYNHVIGQGKFSSLVTDIRAALLGSTAVSATGRSLAQYANLYARDMIMNYHGDVMMLKAQELGMQYFKYVGTVMGKTRQFCRRRVGGVYSKKEIDSWVFHWAGKAGDAFHFRGGYNCRHHWQPVRKEWLSEQAQTQIDVVKPAPKK